MAVLTFGVSVVWPGRVLSGDVRRTRLPLLLVVALVLHRVFFTVGIHTC